MSLLFTGLAGLSHATPVFLIAAAITLIFNAIRLLDLGQAALAGLAAALATRIPLPASTLILVPAALAILGVALDLAVYRRLARAPLMSQLFVALGLFVLFRDAAELMRTSPAQPSPAWAGSGVPVGTLLVIVTGPVVFGLLRLLPRGLLRHRHLVIPLAAALSGLAGVLSLLDQPGSSAGVGSDYLSGALLAVALGGLGSLPGALVAATVLALVSAYSAGLFAGAGVAIPLAITVAVLLLRAHGLLGAPADVVHESPTLPIRPAPRSAQLLLVAGLLLAVAAPFIAPGALPLLTNASLAILLAASLHLLIGPGGIPNLGHAAFFSVGAGAAALVVGGAEPTVPLRTAALAIGAVAAGLAALTVGLLLARLSAPVVAMLTLVVAQLVWTVIVAHPITVHAIAPPSPLGCALAGVTGLGGALLLRRLIYAPFGYALRAARDDPARAAAIGLPIKLLQGAAFAIAGLLAGLAGAVTLLVGGEAAFPPTLDRSAQLLLMLALGGAQAIAAPLVGVLAYTGAADLLPAPWPAFLLGPALVAVPLLLPHGIAGLSIRFWRGAQ